MDLVFIYGPPGAGKLTVATELARLTSYKLFHNHVTIDCVRTVFDFGTPPFFRLVNRMRLDIIEEAAREGVPLIFTFVYAHPSDAAYVEKICGLVEGHGGRVCLVRLACDKTVLERRLQSAGRVAQGKLSSLDTLRELEGRHDLHSPVPGRESLHIDNTALPPAEAAALIVEHYELQSRQ